MANKSSQVVAEEETDPQKLDPLMDHRSSTMFRTKYNLHDSQSVSS